MSRSSDALILFANEAFYAAFGGGDYAAMDDLWAEDAPVACLHPGAAPIFERAEIMKSWQDILAAGSNGMTFQDARVVARGEVSIVVCYEIVGQGALVASNAFVEEGGRWRMVLHQAGPCPGAPSAPPEDRISTRLN